jgi:Peptidase family S41/N-terminal domain of Peptidase_S41 in eukaryotic IRBP
VSHQPWLIGALGLLAALARAQEAAPVIPQTPAGQALGSWLEAFNSGNRARIDSFDKARFPAFPLENAMRYRSQTGGFVLLGIEKSAATQVIFHVREKDSPNEKIGVLILSSTDPSVIATLRFTPVPPGAKFEEVTLDATARSRIITAVGKLLDQYYVFPDVAKKVASALRTKEKHGDYDAIVDGEVFVVKVNHALGDASHDPHLELRYSPVASPPEEVAKHREPDPVLRRQLLSSNCGFEKAQHLPPNIGYLKFNMFADVAICADTAIAAMNLLVDSDALILDLRDNNGGGDMVELIASYLFTEPTHLMDSYDRGANTTTQAWTWAYVPGKRFADKPVFVLTSKGTFSAAEAFSYALQTLKRATLIGETTGGGAHMVKGERIDEHFTLTVPFARSLSPITHKNWEGTGLEPDVKVPAADALTEALKRARHE